ncbi:amidohydrolase [bacterium]|nr:amidohydrolase [bacterium]
MDMLTERIPAWLRRPGVFAALAAAAVLLAAGCAGGPKEAADAVYYNGRVVTLDSVSTLAGAIAVRGGRIMAVGTDPEILRLAGPQTRKVDLGGRTVLPGLIEAHAHPESASTSELADSVPDVHSIDELLNWIRVEAESHADGEWIVHPKLFFTRLAELRAPTLAELDSVAPANPVFLDGSYGGSINSAAMRASGITEKTRHDGLLRDNKTGKLNGLVRFTAFPLIKVPDLDKYSQSEREQALARMIDRYNAAGFTSVTSGGLQRNQTAIWDSLRAHGKLNIRVFENIYIDFPLKGRTQEEIRADVAALGQPTCEGDDWIRTGRLKYVLDGGILTGTAYLSQPWGSKANALFGIDDPAYRGILRLNEDEFTMFCRAGAENGWSMTAHATGGGTVEMMLNAYETIAKERDIRPMRFSIIHGNFFSPESIRRMKELGVIAESQAAWFYKDADAMLAILGPERLRDFHDYRSLVDAGVVVSGGSDHMVRLDDRTSINPYSPWLAMWSMITRRTERGSVIDPEQAVTREEALRFYTVNNAFTQFSENEKGCLTPGRLADFIALDRDYFKCPEDEIKDIRVVLTVVDGREVWSAQ